MRRRRPRHHQPRPRFLGHPREPLRTYAEVARLWNEQSGEQLSADAVGGILKAALAKVATVLAAYPEADELRREERR